MTLASPTDVVARLYDLYHDGSLDAQKAQLLLPAVDADNPPVAISQYLAQKGVSFAELPRALQIALLWDAGLMVTVDGEIAELRTYCGLSISTALELSTFMLPACAIALPSTSTTTDHQEQDGTVWLQFVDDALLPTASMSPSHLDLTKNREATFTSCTTNRDVFQSFCAPQRNELLSTWLADVSWRGEPRRLSLSSMVEESIPSTDLSNDTNDTTSSIKQGWDVAATTDQGATRSYAKGLWSDFASAYYTLHGTGHVFRRIELSSAVPVDVQARLDGSQLKFSKISGILQRALLWDTGYVLVQHSNSSTVVDAVPVYVKCGERMADLAMDPGYFEATGCGVQDCSWKNVSNGKVTYSYRARDCVASDSSLGQQQLSTSVRCAIPTSLQDSSVNVPTTAVSTIWAVGNLSTTNHSDMPNIWLQRYPSQATPYVIHSASVHVAKNVCPSSPSFIIPCIAVDQPSLHKEWCRPIQSEVIATWLSQEQNEEMVLATLILLAGAILVALALDLFADRKPRFFANGRGSVSVPSITSTILEPLDNGEGDGDQSETFHSGRTDDTGPSSLRSARAVGE